MSSTIEAVRRFSARTPLRIAVRSATECLTYRELDLRARQLAHELEARETGVAALVADNGPAWVIADLAEVIDRSDGQVVFRKNFQPFGTRSAAEIRRQSLPQRVVIVDTRLARRETRIG